MQGLEGRALSGRKGYMLQHIVDALMARVTALETEAKQLLAEGEVEAANLKTAFATELKALAAELQSIISHL